MEAGVGTHRLRGCNREPQAGRLTIAYSPPALDAEVLRSRRGHGEFFLRPGRRDPVPGSGGSLAILGAPGLSGCSRPHLRLCGHTVVP